LRDYVAKIDTVSSSWKKWSSSFVGGWGGRFEKCSLSYCQYSSLNLVFSL
jgi:hypothetical protein